MEMSFSVENMNPEKFCHQVCKFFGSVALPSINLQLLQTFVQCMYAIMKNYFINSSFQGSLVVISVHHRLNLHLFLLNRLWLCQLNLNFSFYFKIVFIIFASIVDFPVSRWEKYFGCSDMIPLVCSRWSSAGFSPEI